MPVIETCAIARTYKTYRKQEGLWNSVKGFLKRNYDEANALKPTTIAIEKGQVVGLVGANGAGKTTLLKILSGLIAPSSGHAKVLGFDPWLRSNDFLRRISILLGQKNQLWWDIAAQDSYQLLGRIYEIPDKIVKDRVLELATLLHCREQLNIQLRRLSLGERMKMEIIGSLLHRPEVLYLDEPTIGLDIVAQTIIRNFLASYVVEFKPTIILTSHYMDDISRLADRLFLISEGSIVYDGSVKDFTNASLGLQNLTVKLSQPLEHPLIFEGLASFAKGTEVIELKALKSDMGSILSQIAIGHKLDSVSIEEVGFEEVIHKFLEKDGRYVSTGTTGSV